MVSAKHANEDGLKWSNVEYCGDLIKMYSVCVSTIKNIA
jgi:hypothetical protein